MYARSPVIAYRVAQVARVRSRAFAPASSRGYASGITYSGGQASEGQGGYYGSGGARVTKTIVEHRPEALADMQAYTRLADIMSEVDQMSAQGTSEATASEVSADSKSAIKKIVTGSEVTDLLARLEFNGQPKWGLSESQREVVKAARHQADFS